MRDLREDIAAGLVNVPAEVVRPARLGESRPLDVDALLRSDGMRAWMAAERERAVKLLDGAQRRFDALKARSGAQVLQIFTRSIRSFADRRLARLYPPQQPTHH
jgi:phytoene/squalene synthetase